VEGNARGLDLGTVPTLVLRDCENFELLNQRASVRADIGTRDLSRMTQECYPFGLKASRTVRQ
jgi:hypothetical protein